MNNKYLRVSLLFLMILLPLLIQVAGFLFLLTVGFITGETGFIALPVLIAALLGFVLIKSLQWLTKRAYFPQNRFERYLPFAIVICWYLLWFVILFGAWGYLYTGDIMTTGSLIVYANWFIFSLLIAFSGNMIAIPVVLTMIYLIIAVMLAVLCRKKKAASDKRAIAFVVAPVALCCVIALQLGLRENRVLDFHESVDIVAHEVELWRYEPFSGSTLLYEPETAPGIAIDSDYPVLDGATAAFPVYSAMVQAVYKGLDGSTVGEYVDCTKTNYAYERLIDREIDIFFGAQPSQAQIDAAAEKGVEFVLIPIAKEAFVFFVNSENPVDGLTTAQIQDIYQRKIKNWNAVGGNDEKITPFQRPENSGSQTIMQRIMGDTPLAKPYVTEMAGGMGEIISGVAAYRNYTGAIGYSFRFYATGMNPNENIKLLSLNSIAPTIENIRTSEYPFTVEVYAVLTKQPEGNTKTLTDWMVSEEGQDFIENCGYVRYYQ